MKLLAPDMEEMQNTVKAYYSRGDREAGNAERNRMTRLRKINGIYPSLSATNILQLPVHLVFISLINKLSYDCTINPAVLTDGFLWFSDLTSPDPYGILPILGASLTFMNLLNS